MLQTPDTAQRERKGLLAINEIQLTCLSHEIFEGLTLSAMYTQWLKGLMRLHHRGKKTGNKNPRKRNGSIRNRYSPKVTQISNREGMVSWPGTQPITSGWKHRMWSLRPQGRVTFAVIPTGAVWADTGVYLCFRHIFCSSLLSSKVLRLAVAPSCVFSYI